MISSPSASSSRTTPRKGGSAAATTTTPPPPSQASRWRSGAVRGVYGRRLLDALRATGGGAGGGQPQPRAVKAAADSALALTARGQTRWSRAILLAGAACSRRRVLVKAGGKVRRRRRPPPSSSSVVQLQARDNALIKGNKGKEKEKVQERLRVLGRLVPGCRKLPAPALLEEAADYVAALQMQVSAMRALADALAAAQLSSPSDAEAEAEAEAAR